MREIRETQKKGGNFDARLRSSEDQQAGMGNMATAVALKSVKGRGKTKKIGGTF